MLLAIDPGKDKCGLAVFDEAGKLLERLIIARHDILDLLANYQTKKAVSALVIGQGAFGQDLEKEIAATGLRLNTVFISERNSTLEARRRYWQENKAKGLWRLLPASLRLPPVPVDDYAAVILGERHLKK